MMAERNVYNKHEPKANLVPQESGKKHPLESHPKPECDPHPEPNLTPHSSDKEAMVFAEPAPKRTHKLKPAREPKLAPQPTFVKAPIQPKHPPEWPHTQPFAEKIKNVTGIKPIDDKDIQAEEAFVTSVGGNPEMLCDYYRLCNEANPRYVYVDRPGWGPKYVYTVISFHWTNASPPYVIRAMLKLIDTDIVDEADEADLVVMERKD